MKDYFKNLKFSPYKTGIIIGLCFIASMLLFSKTLASCATYVKLGALLNSSFAENQALYFRDFLKNAPHWFDWPLALATGVFCGSYFATKLSGDKKKEEKLSAKKKWLAFFGGVLVLFGARFAGGCLSGHAVSSAAQMASTSHMFLLGLLFVAVPGAFITSKLLKEED